MNCLYCKAKTEVVNSRVQKRSNQVWRRRQCLSCRASFTTRETIDLSLGLSVKTNSGQILPFSRDKLFLDVYDSLKHRKTAKNDATALTETVLSKLYKHMSNGLVDTAVITDIASKTLKRFDRAAGVIYQANHPT